MGGIEGCRNLSTAFYSRAACDPVLKPLFPGHLNCPIEGLALYLGQFLGGPCEYSAQRWFLGLHEAHARFKLCPPEREAWLRNMRAALDDVRADPSTREELERFFDAASAYLIGVAPAPAQLPCEDLVAAVRAGDSSRVLMLAAAPQVAAYFERDRAGFLKLLGMISSSKDPAMVEFVTAKLVQDPQLAKQRHTYGRTLLHDVAAGGNPALMGILLKLGADPNATDKFGHTPLYTLANSEGDGVQMLVKAGADVNAKERVKRCTPLHMAARRGNTRIAQALLDCGADLEARDIAGDTPLRRAVNCGKANVAELLLRRGADRYSPGARGLTAVEAARGAAMTKLVGQSGPPEERP